MSVLTSQLFSMTTLKVIVLSDVWGTSSSVATTLIEYVPALSYDDVCTVKVKALESKVMKLGKALPVSAISTE